jgi:catechol 2,3-dioxygenase-like lactoylglutathione lyase family enzyme
MEPSCKMGDLESRARRLGCAYAEGELSMTSLTRVASVLVCSAIVMSSALATAQSGKITGFGGVFIKSDNPKALRTWYQDVLGIKLEPWGGALLRYDTANHPPHTVWNAFSAKSDYFAPSTKDFMLNFAVDDMDAFTARLRAKNVDILKRDDKDPNGRFAWIMDPDGTKIELWEPKVH